MILKSIFLWNNVSYYSFFEPSHSRAQNSIYTYVLQLVELLIFQGMLTPHFPGRAWALVGLRPRTAPAADFRQLQMPRRSAVVLAPLRIFFTPLQHAGGTIPPFWRNPMHCARLPWTCPHVIPSALCAPTTTINITTTHANLTLAIFSREVEMIVMMMSN